MKKGRIVFIGLLSIIIIYMLVVMGLMRNPDFDLGESSFYTFTLRHNIADWKYSSTTFVLSSFAVFPVVFLYIGILFFAIVQRLRYSKFDPRSMTKISGHLGLILLIIISMSFFEFHRTWSHLTVIPNWFVLTILVMLFVEGIVVYNNIIHGHKLMHMTVARILFMLIAVLSTYMKLYNFFFFFLMMISLIFMVYYLTDTADTDIL